MTEAAKTTSLMKERSRQILSNNGKSSLAKIEITSILVDKGKEKTN